ncbi:hypothetical protein OG871_16640 [Kitasatospora sp. NBC_00374]|uniref:hypothetical protein n=1 Tax=Kitasatospora sp. NBC_00374 TaxID=2975964 RepID=UPI0032510E7A
MLAGALAASWILPAALDALKLDIVLIPVFVLAIASVLRVGGGLLDRLVVATLVLCGAVLGLGLVLSVGSWALIPVPTAGLILSAVSVSAWVTGRTPRLPLRLRSSDLVILGTGAVVWHYIHRPVAGRSTTEQLPYILSVEDRFIHFSIFDAVHKLGAFPFMDQEAGKLLVKTPTEAVYPQGSHFLLAWFDTFVRSTADLGDPVGAYTRYYTYVLVAFAALCALIVWAARWVGGPRLTGWRTAAVCTVVAAVVIASPLAGMVRVGFDSQIIGLVFMTVSIALIVRPAMGWGSYALVSAAALITVGYAYNILAAFPAMALVVAAIVYRKRQRRHRWRLYAVQAAGAAIALVPSVLSLTAKFDVAAQTQAPGMYLSFDRSLLVGLVLLVVVVCLLPGNQRSGVSRTLLLTIGSATLVTAAFGVWQLSTIDALSYYFEKLAIGVLVISLIGLGAAGALLRPFRPWARALSRPWWTEGVAAVAVSATALSLFGGFQWGVPSVDRAPTSFQHSELVLWSKIKPGDLGPPARTMIHRDLKRVDPNVPVIALYSSNGYMNWRVSFFATTLMGDSGVAAAYDELLVVWLGGDQVGEEQYRSSFAPLTRVIGRIPGPKVTLLVGDPTIAERLRRELPRATGKQITILDAPLAG